MERTTCIQTVAIIFIIIGLGFVAAAFATDEWLNTVVNRDEIPSSLPGYDSNYIYRSRYRGLFRICFPGSNLEWLENYADIVINGWCIKETGYEFSRSADTIGYGEYYTYRIHMMRAQLIVMALAMLFLLIAVLIGGVGCMKKSSGTIKLGAVFSVLGGFLAAASMALCHGIEYMENNYITDEDAYFPASYKDDPAYAELVANSNTSYGFSYFMGWAGVLFGFLGGLVSVCVSSMMKTEEKAKKSEDQMGLPVMGSDMNMPQQQQGYEYGQMAYPNYANQYMMGSPYGYGYGYDAYNTYPSGYGDYGRY